jgi:hypothetical protein
MYYLQLVFNAMGMNKMSQGEGRQQEVSRPQAPMDSVEEESAKEATKKWPERQEKSSRCPQSHRRVVKERW